MEKGTIRKQIITIIWIYTVMIMVDEMIGVFLGHGEKDVVMITSIYLFWKINEYDHILETDKDISEGDIKNYRLFMYMDMQFVGLLLIFAKLILIL